MAARQLEGVADVLQRVVRTLDIERELLSYAAGPAWERAVGSRLAPHTRAVQLRGGVLRVEARSAAWLNEVSLLREQIRERMNAELPDPASVREVRFRLGGGFPALSNSSETISATPQEVSSAAEELSESGVDGARLAARAYALSRKHR